MALIRKAAAGSDSFGHVWPEDGAVVEIDDPEQIAALMAIADAGFSEVTPSADENPESPEDPEDPGLEEKKEISEVDPQAPADNPEDKPAAKKAAARKTTASKPE
ncbi:hypothetical protein [Streptomyces sp. NPDC004008]